MRLVYVMDPMCAWCYGFHPELEEFLEKYSFAEVEWIMGGLAPDTNEPMNDNLKQTIASYWHTIEKSTQVTFNHDYWELNTPYRCTYPACRAVIAAESIQPKSAPQMVKAIQSAYYLEAKNPSMEETLISCASAMDLNENQFLKVFRSEGTALRLQRHLHIAYQLRVRGFPALFYIADKNQTYPLTLGFSQMAELEQQYNHVMENILKLQNNGRSDGRTQ